jgi:DNA-binding beta-propeller fold protein YncE
VVSTRARRITAAAGVLAAAAIALVDTGQLSATVRHGGPRLVSVAPLAPDGLVCEWPASATARLATENQAPGGDPARLNRAPVRVIKDTYPNFSAVALDPTNDELVLQDENLFQIMSFHRTANTPPRASETEPIRVIGGELTKVNYNCALYLDAQNGDVYSVNNDVVDTMVVFSRTASGNAKPDRELHTPHRAYGIAVDEDRQELFLAIQHPPTIVVYDKSASGNAKPKRLIGGDHTGLEDPHGVAIDRAKRLLYVSNHGAYSLSKDGGTWGRLANTSLARRENMVPGSGRYEPPSITVYSLDASGDTRPVRTIEGPRTRLNWPTHIVLDEAHDELFVANDPSDAILVFRASAQGDVAPIRAITGPKTGLKYPTGIVLDPKHDEIVVANMGNHSATVYPRSATGDVAPVRTIRSAPAGTEALAIGNPGAVAYDTKREEILVPN